MGYEPGMNEPCVFIHPVTRHRIALFSQSGNIVLLNGVPIHWRSSRQPRTAMSPGVAEIYAMSLKRLGKNSQTSLRVAEKLQLLKE